jgi:dUTP pyrophosphatase
MLHNKTQLYGRKRVKMISFVLEDGAKLPQRGSAHAAGLDIHCMQDIVLTPHSRQLVYTGVTLAYCPPDVYLRVAPRSKLANKRGIDVLAGVVDNDYRGSIGVILYNTSDYDIELFAGSAIAQLIPECIISYPVQEVEVVSQTVRGGAGVNDKDLRL